MPFLTILRLTLLALRLIHLLRFLVHFDGEVTQVIIASHIAALDTGLFMHIVVVGSLVVEGQIESASVTMHLAVADHALTCVFVHVTFPVAIAQASHVVVLTARFVH